MNYYEARQIICRTKVRVLNKTNSKAIQEKLFSLGCKWEGSESKNKIIKNLDKPFLYTSTGGQIIRWGTSEKVFDKSDYKEISVDDILNINVDEKYRPFINSKECWEEMRKHEPFGWISIGDNSYRQIDRVLEAGLLFMRKDPNSWGDGCIEGSWITSFEEACNTLRFADGTIIGIKLEE